MTLGLQGGFANTWDSAPSASALIQQNNGPSIPVGAVGVVTKLPGTQGVTMSNLGTGDGVVTTDKINGVGPNLPVFVNADYSLWCPVLGIFVRPEQTNFLAQLDA